MRRGNPEQYIIDLRTQYREEYGNDWWKDESIKAQFKKDRSAARARAKGTTPRKSTKATSTQQKKTASKVTDMLDPKLRTAINNTVDTLKAMFPHRTFEVNEDYGGGNTAVVFSEDGDVKISVELMPKRKYVHYQIAMEEDTGDGSGGDFSMAKGVLGKSDLAGDLELMVAASDFDNTMGELRRQSDEDATNMNQWDEVVEYIGGVRPEEKDFMSFKIGDYGKDGGVIFTATINKGKKSTFEWFLESAAAPFVHLRTKVHGRADSKQKLDAYNRGTFEIGAEAFNNWAMHAMATPTQYPTAKKSKSVSLDNNVAYVMLDGKRTKLSSSHPLYKEYKKFFCGK